MRRVDDPTTPVSKNLDTAIAYLERNNSMEALTILKKDVMPKIKGLEKNANQFATYFLWSALTAAIFMSITGVLLVHIYTKLRHYKAPPPKPFTPFSEEANVNKQ